MKLVKSEKGLEIPFPITRMDFVEKWARFVAEHPNREWSRLQAELINSQLENAEQVKLTKNQVEHIKKKIFPSIEK